MLKIIAVLLLLVSFDASAGLCTQWAPPKEAGKMPAKGLNEASGLVISKAIPDRYYWVNDSGDKGYLKHTKANGSDLTEIKIEGFSPRDVEALAYGPCPEGHCIYVGDIGNNRAKFGGARANIEIVVLKEGSEKNGTIKILRRFKLRYPDGARDAEAMTILPNGDLIIVSKELSLSIGAAGVYSLDKQSLSTGMKTYSLKKLGTLPLPLWLKDDGIFSQLVTDAAVNAKRQVLGLLTYNQVVEIPLEKLADISKSQEWKRDTDYAVVPIQSLPQQETMAYDHETDRLIWSSEDLPPDGSFFSMTCDR